MTKAIIVLQLDVKGPNDFVRAMEHINPPDMPCFAGKAHIAVGDHAQHVIDWLDEEE